MMLAETKASDKNILYPSQKFCSWPSRPSCKTFLDHIKLHHIYVVNVGDMSPRHVNVANLSRHNPCRDTTHVARHTTSVICGYICRDMSPNVSTCREMSRHVTMLPQKCLPDDTDMSRRHLMTCQTCHMTCQEDMTLAASEDMLCCDKNNVASHFKIVWSPIHCLCDESDFHIKSRLLMVLVLLNCRLVCQYHCKKMMQLAV
jgi:hypothetical protein